MLLSPSPLFYIQPKTGLEVAINGIAGHPCQIIVNRYLEHTSADSSGDPVIRDSQMELDGAIYCTILRTPHITSRFVSDPFTPFPPPSRHHIRDGFIGIRHLARISRALFPDRVQLPSRTIANPPFPPPQPSAPETGPYSCDSLRRFLS